MTYSFSIPPLLFLALLPAVNHAQFDDFFNFPASVISPAPVAAIPAPRPTNPPLAQTNAPVAPPPTQVRVDVDTHMTQVIPTVQAIELAIRTLIAQDPFMGPKFVRLGFHDCVGGCDGCVDMTLGDNAGLDIPINALSPIVQQFENAALGISRADIWALAAHAAADIAQTRSFTKMDFGMEFIGRQNCEATQTTCFDQFNNPRECSAVLGPHRHLPSADETTDALFHFFSDEFGFDVQETVALMGAHTLGRMDKRHSGFDGPNGWVRDNLLLDNDYYHELVGGAGPAATLAELVDTAPPWERFMVNNEDLPGVPNKPAWRAFPNALDGSGKIEIVMLNADIALVRELDSSNLMENGQVTCAFIQFFAQKDGVPRCPHAARSLSFAAEYKFNNDLWLHDFNRVYRKMLNHGYPYVPDQVCPGGLCVY